MGSGTVNGTVKAIVSQNEDVDSQNETINGSLNNEYKDSLRGSEIANGSLNGSLNKRQLSIIKMIGDYGAINAIDLAEKQKSSLRTMYRTLSVLSSVDFGLVTREGSKKTGNYVLTDKGHTFYKDIERLI